MQCVPALGQFRAGRNQVFVHVVLHFVRSGLQYFLAAAVVLAGFEHGDAVALAVDVPSAPGQSEQQPASYVALGQPSRCDGGMFSRK